jgi:AraC-like DNA-binding protein
MPARSSTAPARQADSESVADRAGFSNFNHFRRLFRQRLGLLPSQVASSRVRASVGPNRFQPQASDASAGFMFVHELRRKIIGKGSRL